MQYIRIRGGVAEVVDEVVRSEAPLADLFHQFETTVPLITDRLPRGTHFLKYDKPAGYAWYVIEEAPRLQRLHGLDTDLPVSLPWTYFTFLVNLNNGVPMGTETTWLHWSKTRVTSLRHGLYKAALPNVFDESTICWGDVVTDSGDAITKIEQRVNEFYINPFNDDLYSLPSDFASAGEWADASEHEYSFEDWQHWHREGTVATLGQIMGTAPDTLPQVVAFPPPPNIFTRQRAIEWALAAPEARRRTLLQAVREALESLPEEPEPELTTEQLAAAIAEEEAANA